MRNAIFFSWEYATYYWLIKEYKKQRKKARRLFFKQKSILLENIKAKRSLKSRIKNVTQCNYRNKKLINLKESLHRNL